MKLIVYLSVMLVLFLVAAFVPMSGAEAQKQTAAANLINGFYLNLAENDEDKCVLWYRKAAPADARAEKVVLDMSAPCEFVRMDGRVLSYPYGKGAERFRAVLVAGGKPHAQKKDRLLPGGCATEFVAVSVFSNGIKRSEKRLKDSAICPSSPLDEKWFGIYARP